MTDSPKKQGSVSGKVVKLLSGSVGAQVILMLAAPILTRLYSPADFGAVAVFNGVLAIILVIASFRLELAIPIPKEEREAELLCVLAFLLVIAFSALSLGFTVFFPESIASALGVDALAGHLWILGPAVFFVGVFQIYSYFCIREHSYGVIARITLLNSITSVAIQIICAPLGVIALIVGQVAGRGVGGFVFLGRLRSILRSGVSLEQLLGVLRAYRNYPLYSVPSAFFKQLSIHAIALIMALYFGAVVAGLYALAYRVLITPLMTLGKAVGNVFLGTAPAAKREGKLSSLVAKAVWALLVISVPSAVAFYAYMPFLFSLVFGSNWVGAGYISQYLTPWLCLFFVASPLSSILQIEERQRAYFFVQIATFMCQMLALLPGVLNNDYVSGIVGFGVVSAASSFLLIAWILRVSKTSFVILVKAFAFSGIVGLMLLMPALILKYSGSIGFSDPVSLSITSLCVAVYLLSAFRFKYYVKRFGIS